MSYPPARRLRAYEEAENICRCLRAYFACPEWDRDRKNRHLHDALQLLIDQWMPTARRPFGPYRPPKEKKTAA
jgi:hypothetical protein